MFESLHRASGKLTNGYSSLSGSPARCAVASILFCGVAFALCNLVWDPNRMNDDWALAIGLSTRTPSDQGYALFLSPLLSNLIFLLNESIPNWNWFLVLEQSSTFLAYCTTTYLAIRHAPLGPACVFVGGLTYVLIPEATVYNNFTVTAGICCMAGLACLICGLWNAHGRLGAFGLGTTLLLAGWLWRWKMLLLCAPLAFLALAYWIFCQRGTSFRLIALPLLGAVLPTLLLCTAAYALTLQTVISEPFKSWDDYSSANALIVDYPVKPYEAVSDELATIGVSENDYALITNWVSADPDFFTNERLAAIADILSLDMSLPGRLLTGLEWYALYSDDLTPCLIWALLFALTIAACCKRHHLVYMLAVFAVIVGIACYMKGVGRLPARVHDPLWFTGFALIALSCKDSLCTENDPAGSRRVLNGLTTLLSPVAPVVSVIFICSLLVTGFSPLRVAALFDSEGTTPKCALTDYMQAHPEDTFVFDADTSLDVKMAAQNRALPSADFLEQAVWLGGWDARSPYALKAAGDRGLLNPIKGLAENDNAVLVSLPGSKPDALLNFLHEHYYPHARYEFAGSIEGSEEFGALDLYLFYRE